MGLELGPCAHHTHTLTTRPPPSTPCSEKKKKVSGKVYTSLLYSEQVILLDLKNIPYFGNCLFSDSVCLHHESDPWTLRAVRVLFTYQNYCYFQNHLILRLIFICWTWMKKLAFIEERSDTCPHYVIHPKTDIICFTVFLVQCSEWKLT